ncbi:MAG: hypothetical protein ACREVV_11890 [Steroidobacteraceae bacterium]
MIRTPTTILLGAEAPRVMTVPMIAAAFADRRKKAARNTVFKWIRDQTDAGILRPVTRGLYLNQLARPQPTAAEAACFVRSGAIVSLQTVLGEAGITNSYSDIITSVLPVRGRIAQSSRSVVTNGIEYRFHAMPARLLDDEAGDVGDRMDLAVLYPRASPEKALLDWIYLGDSPRTKLAQPPLDIDIARLDNRRLKRLANRMKLSKQLGQYLARKRNYDQDPSVRANAPAIER